MKKFKVGDVVRVVSLDDGDEKHFNIGDIGAVLNESNYVPCIKFDHGEKYACDYQLEIIEVVGK